MIRCVASVVRVTPQSMWVRDAISLIETAQRKSSAPLATDARPVDRLSNPDGQGCPSSDGRVAIHTQQRLRQTHRRLFANAAGRDFLIANV